MSQLPVSMRPFVAAVLALACSSPAKGPDDAPQPTASSPSTNAAASAQSEFEREYHQRCAPHEGDPRTWPAQVPSDGDAWEQMRRYSYCYWAVSRTDGQLRATAYFPRSSSRPLPFQPSFRPCHAAVLCGDNTVSSENAPPLAVSDFLQTDSGYLVAYDSGEWGGGLFAYSPSGELTETVLRDNTHRLVQTPNGILAFTGLAHLMTDRGHVLLLTSDAGRWPVNSIDLPGAPLAVSPQTDGTVLVVTSNHLVQVSLPLTVSVLHRAQWSSPNSVERTADGIIYVGANYAVARLTPTGDGFMEEWLAPIGAQAPLPSAR